MGFYEQLRGLMCQNRGLLNTREQSNRGKYQARTTNLLFIVMFHKEAGALKEFIFAASVWTVPVFSIAHQDIPSAQLMAPLHSNLVQYSPRQAEEGGVRYWFYFYKTFSRWSPRPRCSLLPQSLPVPAHQCVIAQTALTSHCQPIVQCPVCPRVSAAGRDHRVICLRYSEYLTL